MRRGRGGGGGLSSSRTHGFPTGTRRRRTTCCPQAAAPQPEPALGAPAACPGAAPTGRDADTQQRLGGHPSPRLSPSVPCPAPWERVASARPPQGTPVRRAVAAATPGPGARCADARRSPGPNAGPGSPKAGLLGSSGGPTERAHDPASWGRGAGPGHPGPLFPLLAMAALEDHPPHPKPDTPVRLQGV